MKFCKYEDLERLVRDYSDGMFSLIFPKVNSREKSLKCIERSFYSIHRRKSTAEKSQG